MRYLLLYMVNVINEEELTCELLPKDMPSHSLVLLTLRIWSSLVIVAGTHCG